MDKNNENNINWDKTFLDIAELVSQHSKCVKVKVGAVLVKDKRIISIGYNGVPSGIRPHCNEVFNPKYFTDKSLKTQHNPYASMEEKLTIELKHREHTEFQKANEIHAEINALLFAARNGVSTDKTTLYTNLSPCLDCTKAIIAAGVSTVIYRKIYRETNFELFEKANIVHYSIETEV